MARIFLTGATGFIGSHVMNQLLARGDEVVALSRKGKVGPHLEGVHAPGLHVVRGDLLEPGGWREVLATCDGVVHIAGWISTRARDLPELRRINVEATGRLWDACRDAGVRRVVYLASIFAHGWAREGVPIDEAAAWDPAIGRLPMPYFVSKREAEELSWARCREGLPVVFGYPGYCIGPGDWYLSSMEVVSRYLDRTIPAYVDGGMSFVDVRDAAAGLIACLDRGGVGEKYLLTDHNLRWRDFFGRLAEVSGVPLRIPGLPPALTRPMEILAGLVEMAWPRGPVAAGDMSTLGHLWWYTPDRARRELGMASRPLESSLRDGVDWLRGSGLLTRVP